MPNRRGRSSRGVAAIAWRVVAGVALLSAIAPCPATASALRGWGVRVGGMASRFAWGGDYWPGRTEAIRWGYSAGVSSEWFDHRSMSMRVGLSYNQRGGALEWASTYPGNRPQTYTDDLRIDYLTASVSFKLRHESRAVVPYVCIGPTVDILLGHWQQCESDFEERPCQQKFLSFMGEDYRSVAYGLSIGAGLELPSLASIPVALELLYERSLSRAIVGVPYEGAEEMKAGLESYSAFIIFLL